MLCELFLHRAALILRFWGPLLALLATFPAECPLLLAMGELLWTQSKLCCVCPFTHTQRGSEVFFILMQRMHYLPL